MPGSHQAGKAGQPSKQAVDTTRRDALKKMGKYSAYTAPALLALLTPKKGRAAFMSIPQ